MSYAVDLLLLNPSLETTRSRSSHFAFAWLDGGHGWFFLPGLFLASYLKARGITTKVIDFELYGSEEENDILSEWLPKARYVGISVMTAQIRHGISLAAKVRRLSRATPIIWGGVHASLFKDQMLKSPLVDHVVSGLGEMGLYSIITPSSLPLEYEFPDLDYSVLEIDRYFGFQAGRRNCDILLSRGCPYVCTFCINSVLKNKWVTLSTDRSIELINFLHRRYRFTHTFIMDESFFCDKERAGLIVESLLPLGVTWEANANARDILRFTDAEFMLLKRSGCVRLRMGAESGSDKTLRSINKNTTVQQMSEARDACLRFGIKPVMSFMVGLPDETEEDIRSTYLFVDSCIRAGAQIIGPQKFRPYPGSKECDKLVARGLKFPTTLEEWASCNLLNTV